MKIVKLYFIVIIFLSGNFFAQKRFVSGKDVFGTRVFVENKGQFNSSTNSSEQIKFAYETSDENIYFTNNGLVYKLIKKFPLSEDQMERIEKGKHVNLKPDEVHFVYMNWEDANKNIEIIESDKQSHYFTYGNPELNSSTFKKITYKNVYNNIDIEYSIPEDKDYGIKYNVILHPGANASDIKMAYSGEVKKMSVSNNEITIKTPLENITEHVPVSYYSNTKNKLNTFYTLSNNIIGFNFPFGNNISEEITIDPWVTLVSSLTSNNLCYDVDYDGFGNLFTLGGLNVPKLAKYNSAGVLQWTFNGVVPAITWSTAPLPANQISNFVVSKSDGKTYLGQPYVTVGNRVVRIDANGVYDNFVSIPDPNYQEIWDMGFNCNTTQLYALGGGVNSNNNGAQINVITGVTSPANFTGIGGASQDVVCGAIDNQGAIFIIFGGGAITNNILRINGGFNGNVWSVPSGYPTFAEQQNKSAYVGGGILSNGFNCLAVNNNYLFYYNGLNLAAYNKNTGAQVASTTVPGLTVKQQGGIVVDDCNNVYVGGNNNILCYNFNGVTFNSIGNIGLAAPSVNKFVYDLHLDEFGSLLYVCGSGFVGTYNAIYSNTCAVGSVSSSVNVSCSGVNNGLGVATLTTSIPNPTINYIWVQGNTTVSATYSTPATTNTVSIPNGTYSVLMQINAPCGPVFVQTVNVTCCSNAVVTPLITQANCTNAINSATINIAGGGTVVPTVTWTPVPGIIGNPPLTATNLPVGITTVQLGFGIGCNQTYTLSVLPTPPPVTFTINNLTGSNSITCTNPTVNLAIVSNYTYGTLSYNWTSLTFTANTSTVSITQANSLTVTVFDAATGCSQTQTVAIGINTIAPTNTAAPLSQAITCATTSAATFSGTVTSPTVNFTQSWYTPFNPPPIGPPVSVCGTSVCPYVATVPGVYTVIACNLVNGCCTPKTVTVTSLDAFPTFSLGSSTNFSIGCAPLNQTTISIINPVSTQTPPATCSYTFLAPSFTGVVTPSVILGNNASTITTIPGTWTLIVEDNSNFCRSIISVPIIQNTVAPNVSATILTQTLTCYNQTLLATGTSSTPNTVINWQVPSVPPLLSTPTVVIGGPPNGPNTSSTSLTYANYTVVAQNTLNACQSTSVVIINQNFKPPISSPTISVGTPTAIFCTVGFDPVVLTTGNSTTTSGGLNPPSFVANPCWQGPSPQTPTCGPSSYSCYIAGVYSLTIMDNYNGCTTTGTINVLDKTQPPVITNPTLTATLDCGSNQASLVTSITGSTTALMYWYFQYPQGAAFSPTAASAPDGANPFLSGTSSQSVNVSMMGIYQYLVTNTITGCQAFGIFNVSGGNLNAEFIPDYETGYPPLLVTFTNNSSSSLGSTSITSVWSFGNGTSQTTTTNINTSATYVAPGSYTVMLIASKGSCLDTAYKVIKVEMPSKLETPNIFTPNGDGSNDIFFLKTANLVEISAIIFDRWGNQVYNVNSSTGNIAWDGKSQQGKDCSAGVYFYIIKATGNDSKSYEVKGNVTLFR